MNQSIQNQKASWLPWRVIPRLCVLLVIYIGIAGVVLMVAIFSEPKINEQVRYFHNLVKSDIIKQDTEVTEHEFAQVFSPFLAKYKDEVPNVNEEVVQKEDSLVAAQAGHNAASSKGFFANLTEPLSSFSIPGVPQEQAVLLRDYIARKFKVAKNVVGALISAVYVVAQEKELDPLLMLGVIAIESRYNPFAESHVGAQGLMQVMPVVHKDKFVGEHGGNLAAVNPIANIRAGGQILRDCIRRRGSVDGGLGCYVGAIGSNDGGYANKVQSERRSLAVESGIALRLNLGKYK